MNRRAKHREPVSNWLSSIVTEWSENVRNNMIPAYYVVQYRSCFECKCHPFIQCLPDGFDAGFRRRCIRKIPVTQKVPYSTTVVRKGIIYRTSRESVAGKQWVNWVRLERRTIYFAFFNDTIQTADVGGGEN